MFDKVKIIKYFLIIILLAMISVIPGEVFQGYLDQYNDFYETTFYLPDDISGDAMLEELTEIANKNSIYIFKICERDDNVFSSSIDIYADDDMLKILAADYGITQGIYKSLFSGETTIRSHGFYEISEELLKSDKTYYLYGDEDDMIQFKRELVDTYAGSFPKDDGFNALESYRSILIVAWLFAIVIVVLITVYDAISQKKENFVRLTMGERTWALCLKNIALDTAYLIFLYNTLKIIIRNMQGNLAFESYSNIMFAIMVLLNAIVFVRFSKIDYKLATADSTSDSGVLRYNYFISASCMIILMVSVASCIELVDTSYKYSNQEGYFKEHKDYNWYQSLRIEDDADDSVQGYLDEFISENPEDFMYVCQGGDISEESDEFFYEASAGSREYLQSEIVELDKELQSELYILISERNMLSEDELSYIMDWIYIDDYEDYEIVYYADPVDIVYRTFDSEPITEMVKNPVIVFHNNADTSTEEHFYEFFLGMVKGSSGRWEQFAGEHNISYVETNAWDYYCYRWESLSRTIIINIAIIAIMMFMYLLVSCVIINMEFKVNAKELVIKKICGYHIFERFGKIYGITGIICVLSVLIILFLDLFVMDINFGGIFGAIISIMCIQYVFITCQIVLYEKKNMQNILKGGNR